MKARLGYLILSVKLILISALLFSSLASAKALEPAPKFMLNDAQGNEYNLADYHGRPLIIHFWATWCPYCKKLQPGLEKLKLEYQDTDLAILGVSFNEDEGADPAGTLKERGISFMTLINGDSAAKAYGVQGTPTTVYINRNGERVWTTNISDPNHPNLKKAAEFILQN